MFKSTKISFTQNDLPTLKGFGNAEITPQVRAQICIKFDGIEEEIDAYVVPYDMLPNKVDILIGQNLTEMPHLRTLKTEDKLVLFAKPEDGLVKMIVKNDCVLDGTNTVEVTTDSKADYVHITSEVCMKPEMEYLIIPGIYKVDNGVTNLFIMTLTENKIKFPHGKVIARGKSLPEVLFRLLCSDTKEQTDMTRSKTFNICRVLEQSQPNQINLEDINIDLDLEENAKVQLFQLLNENRKSFAFSTAELGKTTVAEMYIRLKDDAPVNYRPYRLSFSERQKVKDILEDLLHNDIIRESNSEYASPIIVVPKKNGDPRVCVDFRALNKKTYKDKYPMPLIEDQVDSLSGQQFFTTLDLSSGYHQIPITEESKHLTAFVTPDGHFEYNRMPFGLCNAPAVFQRMIHKVLNPKKIPGVLTYMDDIIIASKTVKEGMERLTLVLDALKEANLTLNLAKCNFFKRKIEFLGLEISSDGIKPGLKKTEAVASFGKPKNAHEVRQFIGLASFFRRFVQGFATIAKPLTNLTKQNVPFNWGPEQEDSFVKLKEILSSRPVLAIYDPAYLTELHTDASQIGLGGILLQRPNEQAPLMAVSYFSRQTSPEEQHFHSFELETLAIVASLKRFRTYLLGIEFKIVTDCHAVRQTWVKRDLVPRIARWWLQAQEYTFSIEYRPGIQMRHADALSRNPAPTNNHDSTFDVLKIGRTDLSNIQMTDPHLNNIKCILDNNCSEAKEVRNNYVLKDGKLYRRVGDELKWAVPQDARWKVCHMTHDECGHFSFEKTFEKLKQTYWFPRMRQFTKKYVQACIPCAYAKQSSGRKEGFLHPIPKTPIPFHCIHIDHLGPFTRSKLGMTYILGIIDGFTKFIILRAVRNTKSKTTISVLRDLFGIFGTPKIIVSDRGTSFTSGEFQQFAHDLEIKHVKNAVAIPRANGQIERYNMSILASLAALTHGDDDKNWDTHLNTVQWSLNNTVNKGIGRTPVEVMFCKPTVGINETHLHEVLDEPRPINDDIINSIRNDVSQKIVSNQADMTERFNARRCRAKIYKEGDLVLVQKQLNNPGDSNKLLPRYSGPYKVTKVLPNDRYEVTSIEGFSKRTYTNVYAAEKIKPWITFSINDNEHDMSDNEPSESSEKSE